MLRKLKLYGELAEFIGHKEFEVQVNTLQKAMSFLVNNFPQVEKYMNTKHYQVKVGNYEIDKTELNYPIGQEDIHIVPVIAGAGGVGKTILGVGLIAASMGTFGGFVNTTIFSGAASTGATITFGVGANLALTGVSEMLFPLPKPKEFMSEQDPKLSFNFSGTQNTSRAGTPVPLCFGEIITGSVVISGSVDTHQVVA